MAPEISKQYSFTDPRYAVAHSSMCHLDIYELSAGKPVVILTEKEDNPGTSVTNAYETIATSVYKEFIEPHGIPPERVTWVEHYPARKPFEETYDRVTMDFDMAENRYLNVHWAHLPNLNGILRIAN